MVLVFIQQFVRLIQFLADFFSRLFSLRGCLILLATQPFKYHDKLVTTEPGYGITFAQSGLQPARHLDQQLITHGMALCVIDCLEVIQIQKQQCAMLAAAQAGCHRLLQTIH